MQRNSQQEGANEEQRLAQEIGQTIAPWTMFSKTFQILRR
jgi:hypothetical protein